MPTWQLAQLNIATMRMPLDDPRIADFVAALEPVNAVADRADGFVWRLQGEGGDATSLRPFGDDVLVNMSVWRDLAALRAFMGDASHTAVMRRRREWFSEMAEAWAVLWWVPEGHRPTLAEAKQRLDRLRATGPTAAAFSFRVPFPAPGGAESNLAPAGDPCPAT